MNEVRKFRITSGIDFSITLSIDTSILTPEWAKEISEFWAFHSEVLDASDGDVYQAVARYAAPRLWGYLEDYNEKYAVETLHEQEGWCIPIDTLGITIIDHELPDLSPVYLEVEEMS